MAKHLFFFILLMLIYLIGITQEQHLQILRNNLQISDLVLIGKVTGSHSFWDADNKNIFTEINIKVLKTIKGDIINEAKLTIKGGIVDHTWHKVNTYPEFQIGESGIFFMKTKSGVAKYNPGNKGTYLLTGGRNGFIRMRDYQDDYPLDILPDPELIDFLEQLLHQNTKTTQAITSIAKNTIQAHSIQSISPKVSTAGTGSMLNISGKGFGNQKGSGEVWFVNSEDIYTRFTDNGFEVKTWSDTSIQIIIPDQAATGKVWVRINGIDAESPENLTIRYSVNNVRFKPVVLYNTNQTGGYTWHIDSALLINMNAYNLIKKSIGKWVCATQVPWIVGDPINVEPGWNGLSTISFGEVEYALAEANYYYHAVVTDGELKKWAVSEMDIVFSDDVKWAFNRNNLAFDQFDFETVALHELGHAHMIGHVNNEHDLMHYSIGRQIIKHINSTNIESGLNILNQSLQLAHPSFENIILPELEIIGKPLEIAGATEVCTGQRSVTYAIPPVMNADSYIWTLPIGVSGKSITNIITVDYTNTAQSGLISVAAQNLCGPGEKSILPVQVNKTPPPPVITVEGNTLRSSANQGNQWFFHDVIIQGATRQEYTIVKSGNYSAVVTLSGCQSDTSNILYAILTDMNEVNLNRSFKVYPNPFYDTFTVEPTDNTSSYRYEIRAITGQSVKNGEGKGKTIIYGINLNSGIYTIIIDYGKNTETMRIIKYPNFTRSF